MSEFWIEGIFVFSLIWSIGAVVDHTGRLHFDTFLRDRLSKIGSGGGISIPKEGLVYDYFLDFEDLKWKAWTSVLVSGDQFQVDPTVPHYEILVPTTDTIARQYLLDILVRHGIPTLFCGETATGKTCEISRFLFGMGYNSFAPLFISMSRTMTSAFVQDRLEGTLERRKGGRVLSAPKDKKLILFADNVDTPKMEEFGAQPPLELLRQLLDHKGWYDKKDRMFRPIEGVSLVAAMSLTRGFNRINPRFLRHFHLIHCIPPQTNNLTNILTPILKTHLSRAPKVVYDSIPSLVTATLQVYNSISSVLYASIAKPHYIFSPLLDILKVFRGLISGLPHIPSTSANIMNPSSIYTLSSKKGLVRWWFHECLRVFGDRLIDKTDGESLWSILTDIAASHLNVPWVDNKASVVGHYTKPQIGWDRLIFSDLMGNNYEEVMDYEKLVSSMKSVLEDHNADSSRPMNLHLFIDAIEHVLRILRVLKQPQGHVVLLGMGGCGRNSAARLACYAAGYELFEPTSGNKGKYGVNEWRNDLKNLLRLAGLQGQKVVFTFSSRLMANESFLEDMHSLIHTGSIADLFSNEELDAVIQSMRASESRMTRAKPVSPEYTYSRFVSQVKANLHVILCMSHQSAAFKESLRIYPSLITDCTIDYLPPWPDDALKTVAEYTLNGISLDEQSSTVSALPSIRSSSSLIYDLSQAKQGSIPLVSVVNVCVEIHQTIGETADKYTLETRTSMAYITTLRYLQLLSTIKKVLENTREKHLQLTQRLVSGLEKLNSVSVFVTTLQAELSTMVPQLESTTKEVELLMVELTAKKIEAEATRTVVQQEEQVAAQEAAEAKSIQESAEAQLAEALPALQEATEACNKLSRKDITELKSFTNPPASMTIVIEALCILFHRKPRKIDGPRPGTRINDYWPEARILLNDPRFLPKLLEYDKDNIAEETITKLRPYITNPHFVPSTMEKVSMACKSLCAWVRAMEHFYWVSTSVAPRRKRLEEANLRLKLTMEKLNESRQKLQDVEDRVLSLSEQLTAAEANKNEILTKVRDCEVKLVRANKLIGGLGGERIRWETRVQELYRNKDTLLGDALLSSAFLVYLGPFSAQYRVDIINTCKKILLRNSINYSDQFSLPNAMTDPIKIRSWQLLGLPQDTHSIENAILVTEGEQWPLLVDPQNQADRWVIAKEGAHLGITATHLPEFMKTLEHAIQFGTPLLVDVVDPEEIDSSLDPLLQKQTFLVDGVESILLGNTTVPYNQGFRLFLTCKHPTPVFSQEIVGRINLVNFAITPQGLEDQLLGIVVNQERAELEQQKTQLTESITASRRDLKEIEDKILYLLFHAQGNILEDEILIETLAQSKKTSDDVTHRLEESIATEWAIDQARTKYQPVANRATVLYFTVYDLAQIDRMYQFSLRWFVELFVETITKTRAESTSTSVEDRVDSLNKSFTYNLFYKGCRSIFEQHKLVFAFMIAIRILQGKSASANNAKFIRDSKEAILNNSNNNDAIVQNSNSNSNSNIPTNSPQNTTSSSTNDSNAVTNITISRSSEVNMRNTNEGINETEWQFLTSGWNDAHRENMVVNPVPKLLDDLTWDMIHKIATTLPSFYSLDESFVLYSDQWKAFLDSPLPHKHKIPPIPRNTPPTNNNTTNTNSPTNTNTNANANISSPNTTTTNANNTLNPNNVPNTNNFLSSMNLTNNISTANNSNLSTNTNNNTTNPNTNSNANTVVLSVTNATVSPTLSTFQKLILLRALRPDKVKEGIQLFVKESLGSRFLEPPTFDLEASYSESSPTKPLIFILSSGDPTESIFDFAQKKGMMKKINSISLGQGQGPVAEKLIMQAIDRGNWVLLMNCHLAASWMSDLEKIVKEIPPDRVHHSFRLWLTTTPTPSFPASILQAGVKITNEPPKGIRGSLLRSFKQIDQTIFDSRVSSTHTPATNKMPTTPTSAVSNSPSSTSFYGTPTTSVSTLNLQNSRSSLNSRNLTPLSTPHSLTNSTSPSSNTLIPVLALDKRIQPSLVNTLVYPKLVFGLCFFHALAQERSKFGPLGTNVPFKSSESDLAISLRQLETFVLFPEDGKDLTEEELFSIPGIETLKYMVGECNYGGRVTDRWDVRVLRYTLEGVCSRKILQTNYKFSESGVYYAPEPTNYQGYLNYIKQLPLNDPPEVFGLHENADITQAISDTASFFETIMAMQPKYQAIIGSTGDDIVMTRAMEILDLLPQQFSIESYPKTNLNLDLNSSYANSSMEGVLLSEMLRYNNLLNVIKNSLGEIQNAVKGLIPMNLDLETLRGEIISSQVPSMWMPHSYPTLKPLQTYIQDLCQRLAFIKNWRVHGPPKVFWMGGFFTPRNFVTGILQSYSRKYSVPIDTLRIVTSVLDKELALKINAWEESSEHTIHPVQDKIDQGTFYIKGLFMEGARWDDEENLLVESKPKELYTSLPYISISPQQDNTKTLSSSIDNIGANKSFFTSYMYTCPVYITLKRSGNLTTMAESDNFVMAIDLPSLKPEEIWVKRGTALFCQLNT